MYAKKIWNYAQKVRKVLKSLWMKNGLHLTESQILNQAIRSSFATLRSLETTMMIFLPA
jgi:hypothetical protein